MSDHKWKNLDVFAVRKNIPDKRKLHFEGVLILLVLLGNLLEQLSAIRIFFFQEPLYRFLVNLQ
jgi:hypothetical protein